MKAVSVIVVNFNGGPLLADCVESILNSSIPVEVIVCDNQSTDLSLLHLRLRFAGTDNLLVIENPANLGFARANNIALSHANGDYLLFLNPDCIIQPDTLEKMIAVLEGRPEVGMAGCLIQSPDGTEQPGCRRNIPTPWRTFLRMTRLSALARYDARFESYIQTGQPIPEEPVEVEAISGAFMLVRRSVLDELGPLDEGYFMHCEDLDWCMRFHLAQRKILFVPSIRILHVGGVCSASRPIAVEYYKHLGMVRFYRKFFRHRYPAILMWLVIAAVSGRFLLRAAVSGWQAFFQTTPPRISPSGSNAGTASNSHRRARPNPGRHVVVTGATSLIGDYLLPGLLSAGYRVTAVSRRPPDLPPIDGLDWHRGDISLESFPDSLHPDILIHLAPLAVLPPLLERLRHPLPKRILAFGSTSLFTKYQSGHELERSMARGLQDAEERLTAFASRHGIAWTVFRPTLVYHIGRDKNITTIAHFIRRFGLFPLVGDGEGRRQPVHAEDLATACLQAIDNPKTFGKAYNLSGGETLSYREMVLRVAAAIGKPCRIVDIPLPLLRAFLQGLSWLPAYRHLTPEMATRINCDMCFDHCAAERELGFVPRTFLGPRQPLPQTDRESRFAVRQDILARRVLSGR